MGIYERPRRSPGKRLLTLLALLALVMSVGLFAGGAGAVHDINVFELDGNATDSNASGTRPDDWSTLFPTNTSPFALATAFVTDPLGDDDRGFGSGLTKDTQDIDEWTWVDGATSPEKDDIAHAYAATYVDPATQDQIVYFGQDRAPKPQGATAMGFWFFQNEVGLDDSGGFTGVHADGDVLITSDMTNGGNVSIINVFKWQGGELVLVASSEDADCGGTPDETEIDACAIANSAAPITVPWDYPSPGEDEEVPENIFFEGGLNLSELFDGDVPCFSSFLANTRTSPSETADLKDFALGDIDTCGSITIIKDAQPDTPGLEFDFDATGESLTDFSLIDPGSNSKTFGDLGPGAYSVTEVDLPQFWTLTNLSCQVSGSGTSAQTDLGTETATITLGVAGHVTCTYVNTFQKQNTTTATTSSPNETTVTPGTSASDSATVTGVVGGPAPTGNVTFFLCQPATVTTNGGTCSAGGSQVGAPVALTATNPQVSPPTASATSSSTTTTTAEGKYCWRAEYAGDSFYNASSHTNSTTECFTVAKLPSQTATTSSPTGPNVVPGTSATDTATVTGTGLTPTGTVTFFICKPGEGDGTGCPSGGTQVGSAVALVAGSATSAAFTDTTAEGRYCWRAVYSGDTIYNGSTHTNATSECFTVAKRPSNTATTSNPTGGDVVPGTAVTDTATITGAAGTPTGSVTFYLCQPDELDGDGECSTGGTQIGDPVTLAGGQATSESTDDTWAIGTYCWRAEYSGDTVYNPSSHTNDDSECFTTVKQPSEVATTSTPTGGGVLPGASVSDHAVVSGDGPTPTGSVTFYLCQPDELDGNDECSTGGTQIGDPVTLDGDGEATSASTDDTTAIGTYCWRAEYSGDDFYEPSSHTNDDSECFTTLKQPSNTTTTSNPTGGDVEPGTSVTDTATVTGGQGQPTPTGSVEFFLCQPDEVAANGGDCDSDGDSIGEVDLENGSATSPATDDTTAIGTYCWRAEYSGDDFYEDSSHTNNDTECFTTVKQPSETQTTSQPDSDTVVPGTEVSDLATVSGGPGQPIPTGTVTFFLCQPDEVTANGGDCDSDGDQIGDPVTLDEEGDAESESTDDTTAIGTYCWRAEYSGDDFYNESSHTNSDTECFTTVKQPSEVATTSAPTGGNVARGTSASDTATVAGDGPTPTGTVTFYLCQPNQVGPSGCTGGTQIGDPVTLENGVAHSASTSNTNADGKYCWRAVYSGDGFYLGDEHTNTTSECFTVVPPPPPPPNPVSDIRVTKAATPQVTLQQGQTSAPITYTIVVTNNGPDPATNAVLADPAPTGVQFSSASPSKGSCTVIPALVSCVLGNMAVGEQITITIQATISVTGTTINVVTVNADNDSVASNNQAQAPTVVVAPVTPPTPKPKPKPEICDTLIVTQKSLKANGKKQKVTAKVTEGKKPVKGAKVVLTGPGIKKTGKTNSKGIVTFTVSPTRSGIIRVEIRGSKACNTQRIGVVGVFEPPVTG